jgi:hypothetical protein
MYSIGSHIIHFQGNEEKNYAGIKKPCLYNIRYTESWIWIDTISNSSVQIQLTLLNGTFQILIYLWVSFILFYW